MTGRMVTFCNRTLSCLLLILTLSAHSSLANDNATASDADLTSDAAFNKAVQAVKQKNYADAVTIFEAQQTPRNMTRNITLRFCYKRAKAAHKIFSKR